MAENESISDRFLSYLGLQRKSLDDRPNYGRDESLPALSNYGYALSRDLNDYPYRECGDLSGSSLVMAVCNDTGIALAEAEPAVRRPDKDGQLEKVDHALAALISNPNPYHIWEDYCLAGAFSWWVDGNWYMQKVRDESGDILELWYLPHFLVEPRWPNDGKSPAVPIEQNTEQFLSHYQYSIPGKAPILIPAKDIVHLKRGVNLSNPRKGIDAFESLITEIYGDKKAAYFSATVLKNMGIVVPIISPKDKDVVIDGPTAEQIKQRYMQQTTGENSGAPLINTVAVDVSKFAFSPQELDLKALRMVPESRIAAVTRYPAAYLQFLVGLQNGTSYASYKEAREQAYESVIAPIQKGVARRINQQLVPEFKDNKNVQFYFDVSNVRVLQEDQDALMRRAVSGYTGGVLKKSDARKMLNLETTPEDEVYRAESAGSPLAAKAFPSLGEVDQYLESLEPQIKEFMPDACQ